MVWGLTLLPSPGGDQTGLTETGPARVLNPRGAQESRGRGHAEAASQLLPTPSRPAPSPPPAGLHFLLPLPPCFLLHSFPPSLLLFSPNRPINPYKGPSILQMAPVRSDALARCHPPPADFSQEGEARSLPGGDRNTRGTSQKTPVQPDEAVCGQQPTSHGHAASLALIRMTMMM